MNPDQEGVTAIRRVGDTCGTEGCIPLFGANNKVEDSRLFHLGDATNPRLGIGGSTASFPSIKRSATAIHFRLADDSAMAPVTAAAITADSLTASGAVAAASHTASADAAGATELPRLSQLQGSIIRKTSANIDAKALATTAIFTTENAGRSFYAMAIQVEAVLIDTHTSVASLSIGNGAGVDEILAITACTGLTATGMILNIPLAVFKKVAPNTAISVKVTTAADGTTETYKVRLIGYYE